MALQYLYKRTNIIEETENVNATHEFEFHLNEKYDQFRVPDLRQGLAKPLTTWCLTNIGPYREGKWFYYMSENVLRIQIDNREKALLFKLECC